MTVQDSVRMAAVVLASFALACGVNRSKPAVEPPAVASSNHLKFAVANSADSSMMLPGVEVSVLMASGETVVVGNTDGFGEVRVPKKLLDPGQAKVVLFCEEHFFCGALQANDPSRVLRKWDEYFLELAPVAVR